MPKDALFSFTHIPQNANELSKMREFGMKDPFARAALTVLVLCYYIVSPEDVVDMINLLSGPVQLSILDVEAMKKQLGGSEYIPLSYLSGATPENGYEPSLPLIISVRDTPFSYEVEGYVTLYVQSSGAESPRSIQLRSKSSTGEWFLWGHELLDPILEPTAQEPYS